MAAATSTPTRKPRHTGLWVTLGILLAPLVLVALMFGGIIVGAVGLYRGVRARKEGKPFGSWNVTMVVAGVVGVALFVAAAVAGPSPDATVAPPVVTSSASPTIDAQDASERASKRAELARSVEAAQKVLDASTGKVLDESLRVTLSEAIAAAEALPLEAMFDDIATAKTTVDDAAAKVTENVKAFEAEVAAKAAAEKKAADEAAAKKKAQASQPQATSGTALAALATIKVSDTRLSGYDRDLFGSAWADIDGNGCDQRNDILRRDFTTFSTSDGCVVTSGTFSDPYTGKAINFVRGQGTSNAVQIDHVVALSDGWQSGAAKWSETTREQFANDPLNLLAADGPTNMAKSDDSADEWMPPNNGFHCSYVARQVAVKAKYDLAMTSAEHTKIKSVLSGCGNTALPQDNTVPKVDTTTAQQAPAKAPPKQAPEQKARTSGGSASYKNCTAVWDKLGRPITSKDPGYGAHLDRDGDGTGCESKP